jgi:hypothetical protein
MTKKRLPRLNALAFRRGNEKRIDCFAPRNHNEEDRELEGVSNIMGLYKG